MATLTSTLQYLHIICLAAVLLEAAVVIEKRQTNPKEIKQGKQMTLCGYQIYMAFQYCCSGGCARRVKREVADVLKSFQIHGEKANVFLKKRRRRSHGGMSYSNANEECCNESCTFEEIKEYDCN